MTTNQTFKNKVLERIFDFKFNNGRGEELENMYRTPEEVTDEIISMFDSALTELVVEERVNRRGICAKTIRKIREQILYVNGEQKEAEDDNKSYEYYNNKNRTLPEPK